MDTETTLTELRNEANQICSLIGSAIASKDFDQYMDMVTLYDKWFYKGYIFLQEKGDERFQFFKMSSGVRSLSSMLSGADNSEMQTIPPVLGVSYEGKPPVVESDGVYQLETIRNAIKEKLKILTELNKEIKPALYIDNKSGNFVLNGKELKSQIQPETVRYIVLKTLIENSTEHTVLEWKDIMLKINSNLKKEGKNIIEKGYVITLVSEYKKIGLKNLDGNKIISIRKGRGLNIDNLLLK
ncbi:MAG TPA: hypothetical protein VGO63_02120 [Candidatus Paceibacterota bacterium]|jgi:hypothetical protein|nr:hypothetical protein [Candidatus Paceibacterota bacterium]